MPTTNRLPKTAPEAVAALLNMPAARERVRNLVEAGRMDLGTLLEMETDAPETGMVPLDEQLTEAEQAADVWDQNADPLVVPVAAPEGEWEFNPHHPWESWESPETRTYELSTLRVDSSPEGLFVGDMTLSAGALAGLGYQAGFPAEFVEKLPTDLAAAVINDRIQRAKPHDVSFILDGQRATQITTGNREVIPARRVAELSYDFLQDQFGAANVDFHRYAEGNMLIRFATPIEAPITRTVGDVLRLGVTVEQEYGEPLSVSLHALRLVCLNGMTADRRLFAWKSAEQRTRAAQENWLREALGGVRLAFDRLQGRSRLMAETRFTGDYVVVLGQTARAMRLPARYMNDLIAAYEAEPGDSQWHILNALTRTASHAGLSPSLASRMMNTAGDWALNFSNVTAVLPRSMALAVGARIVEEA